MEEDFQNFFTMLGKTGPALVPFFKDANYKGVSFRLQAFTREDLGICYLLPDDFFVFSSSGENLIKTIDKLTE
ncbi:hypothetical protein KJA15_00120 [Patescibacteria group bacterium]|nr:hypothetical protein [Patescibacteria group bacterium]